MYWCIFAFEVCIRWWVRCDVSLILISLSFAPLYIICIYLFISNPFLSDPFRSLLVHLFVCLLVCWLTSWLACYFCLLKIELRLWFQISFFLKLMIIQIASLGLVKFICVLWKEARIFEVIWFIPILSICPFFLVIELKERNQARLTALRTKKQSKSRQNMNSLKRSWWLEYIAD